MIEYRMKIPLIDTYTIEVGDIIGIMAGRLPFQYHIHIIVQWK
jgi:hypothetical protein